MNNDKMRCSYEVPELIFGYLEEETDSSVSSYESSIDADTSCVDLDEDEEEGENKNNVDERKAFWDSQGELLEATLYRTTKPETSIRQATKNALKELYSSGVSCLCQKTVVNSSCRNCTQKQVSNRLREEGFNCVICKANWRSSPGITAGQHTYLEVSQNSVSKKGEVKVVVELNFRAEFEMSRASEEYNKLIEKLPEVFVGKLERLKSLIKILCYASKKCLEENKMHIAPWRTQKYMQAKWQGTPLPLTKQKYAAAERRVEPPIRRAFMLAFDFGEALPAARLNAVRVI